MTISINRAAVQLRLSATLRSRPAITQAIGDPTLPDDLTNWLGRLLGLHGVPFPWLVPDERMLPLESIRFFRLDRTWTAALIDGAYSIGRNLSTAAATASMALDHAAAPALNRHARTGAARIRAIALGVAPLAEDPPVISGFLLRSAIVGANPGLEVNAFADDGTARRLLRLDRLGTSSNVLLALIAGDAARIDIHEPPEHLHFGIDSYRFESGKVVASKNVHPFTRTDPVGIDRSKSDPKDFSACFRANSPRTMRMKAAAGVVGAANSAEMGFAMTEGVGLVSFRRGTP
jgi:hypothetical protein